MMSSESPFDQLDYPLDYEFKAFGPNHDDFNLALVDALKEVVTVSQHALRVRASSNSKHRCVTILVRVTSRKHLEQIYHQIHGVEGLRYLL
ncbi:MAG: hypothetical protein C0624_05275 [Desulfuromonas sp.]|nr:MAG: hypothetical protein C0624_05275 [Desulfuromonas sp.]